MNSLLSQFNKVLWRTFKSYRKSIGYSMNNAMYSTQTEKKKLRKRFPTNDVDVNVRL